MKWPFVRRSKYEYLMKCLDNKNDLIANQIDNIKSQFFEINRLNQELANEMNSHRETKKKLEETKDLWHKSLDHNDSFLNEIRRLEEELKETKDALKIAQDDLENAAICIGEQKTQLEIWKKRSNFYSNNCTEAKESISKARSTLRQIAKKL